MIVWWEVETPDPTAFQDFHAAMWGWTFRRAFAETDLPRPYWVITAADGTTLGGLIDAPVTPVAGSRLYLEVADLDATLARAVELGATVEQQRIDLGGDDRWSAIIRDPAGISLGLWAPSAAGVPAAAPAEPVVVGTHVPAGLAEVWVALAEQTELWWPGMRFEARPGATLTETWTADDGTERTTHGTIDEVDHGRRLRFRWADESWPAPATVAFDLHPDADGTTVIVAETGLPGGPDQATAHREGWQYHLGNLRRRFTR